MISRHAMVRIGCLLALLLLIQPAPAAIAGSRPGVPPVAACCTDFLAVSTTASVTWGFNDRGQLGTDGPQNPLTRLVLPHSGIQAAAAGRGHTLILLGGMVFAWGANDHGQLGDGTTTSSTSPVQVLVAPQEPLAKVVAIAAGGDHSLAITQDGRVWAWGDNTYGQLGDGTTISRSFAVPVPGLAEAWEVEAGPDYSLAVTCHPQCFPPYGQPRTTTGLVWAWGRGDLGQLGNGTRNNESIPTPVPDPAAPGQQLSTILENGAIAAGGAHVLVVRPDFTVWSWGDNSAGQLGDGTTTTRLLPGPVPGLSPVYSVAAGQDFSLAVSGSSSPLWAWGDNGEGQLGDGTTTSSVTPRQAVGLGTTFISSVAAGSDFALAVVGSGVLAWGNNSDGQLGLTSPGFSPTPQAVPGIANAFAATAGYRHSVALVTFEPVTSATVTPAPNANNWNNTPVSVTLSVTTNPLGPPATATYYSVDDINCGALANGQAPAGDCTRYTGPFSISAPGDHTVSFFSFDQYGDTEGQNAIGVHIDTTPPVITLSAPENDALFVLNQQVPASYGCTDALSGVATCVAPVPSGTPIDTASAGTKTFQVQASDNAGNTATAEVSYRVTFNVCESSAARHGKGTATRLTIRVRLCDMNQADVSSRSIPVVVAGVTPGSRSAIRGRFRFSASGPGGPDYTLSVLQTQFKRGKYRLRFRAGADPITHSLTFTVR